MDKIIPTSNTEYSLYCCLINDNLNLALCKAVECQCTFGGGEESHKYVP